MLSRLFILVSWTSAICDVFIVLLRFHFFLTFNSFYLNSVFFLCPFIFCLLISINFNSCILLIYVYFLSSFTGFVLDKRSKNSVLL